MAPYTAHRTCPLMKLPGNTFVPCSNQMVPISTANAPATLSTSFVTLTSLECLGLILLRSAGGL
jgi:hypothetical protein